MYREIARHSARFYALRAASGADGSRPIPTLLPEKGLYSQLCVPRPPQTKKPCGLSTARECFVSLFRLNSTGGANALASAAVNAGSCIDNSLVLHGDCANGAGVNTCTASNAGLVNGMSHHVLLISVLIVYFVPIRPCTAAPRIGTQSVCSAYCVIHSVSYPFDFGKCHILIFFSSKTQATPTAAGRQSSGSAGCGARLPPRI